MSSSNSTTAARPSSSTAIFRSSSSEIPLPDSEVELSDNMDIDQVSPPPSLPPTLTFVNILGTLIALPTPSESARDPRIAARPTHVSLLAGKYLLSAKVTGSSPGAGTAISSKEVHRCINVETREQFLCRILPRNATGLGFVEAYHRLEEFSDCVCPIHEIVMSPRLVYIMFPPHYGSVHSYLMAKKKLTEAEAALIFKQMVSAVHYCHGKGIVLRDLKMDKFVFCDEERTQVKLDSLEDATMLSDYSDDALSDKVGSWYYVSPEKINSLRSNDDTYPGKATDIWGLGIILYKMLVGIYPFNDDNRPRLFVKIRRAHLTTPKDSSLTRSVRSLLMGLLNKNPLGRLNCEQILSHSWLLNNGSSPRTPTPTPRRTGELNNSRTRRNGPATTRRTATATALATARRTATATALATRRTAIATAPATARRTATATAPATARKTGELNNSRNAQAGPATGPATATEPIDPAQLEPNSSEQDDDQVVPEFNVF